jgi:Golgi phosphoprotein 3 (GPP34)
MLLAEDLLLLVTDDAIGRLSVSRWLVDAAQPGELVDAGLGGANLVELTLLGKVDVSGEQDQGRRGRIIVRDPSPPGDEVLDAALQTLVKRQGRKPSAVIRPLGKKLRRVLYQRLAARGVLRAERRRVLGIFPVRTWPAADPGRKAEVRQQVTQALAGTAAPDERTAALIALLHAVRCEHKVVDPRSCQLSRRQLRARAAEIAQGNWASEAVRKAIKAINEEIAAVVVGIAAAGAALGSSR